MVAAIRERIGIIWIYKEGKYIEDIEMMIGAEVYILILVKSLLGFHYVCSFD